jgi:hypothetical protein
VGWSLPIAKQVERGSVLARPVAKVTGVLIKPDELRAILRAERGVT